MSRICCYLLFVLLQRGAQAKLVHDKPVTRSFWQVLFYQTRNYAQLIYLISEIAGLYLRYKKKVNKHR